MSEIQLIARRQEDLHSGRPDYHVYAAGLLVGRIYQNHFTTTTEGWWWGVNSVTLDMTVGAAMQGYAANFEEARGNLRRAFDRWLEWAKAIPGEDLKYPRIAAELKAIGDD